MSDDNTPTTEQVRELVLTGHLDYPGVMTDVELFAAFDRWLAGVRAEQRKKRRPDRRVARRSGSRHADDIAAAILEGGN